MPAYVQTRDLRDRPVRPQEIARRAEQMLAALGLRDAELSILLCSDAVIHELNRDYRHIDRPTDVLAFAMREGEGGDLHEEILGDVIISLDTARRQAREQGRTISFEVTFLLAHGLLHLLGHDHRDREEERRMTARTDALLSTVLPRLRGAKPKDASPPPAAKRPSMPKKARK